MSIHLDKKNGNWIADARKIIDGKQYRNKKSFDTKKEAKTFETDFYYKLENDLLNFNTYGLENLWTVYHSSINKTQKYNFAINVTLTNIIISPEQINERQIIKKAQVKNGRKHALDKDGNVLKDSSGKKIKVDNFKTIRCRYNETRQFKSSSLSGVV